MCLAQGHKAVTLARLEPTVSRSITLPINMHVYINVLFVWFGSVNSYGHVGMVSSPNHPFFLGKLD